VLAWLRPGRAAEPGSAVAPAARPAALTSPALTRIAALARDPAFVVAALLSIAVPLRLVGLTESLWFDELGATWYWLHPTVFHTSVVVDAHPPLFSLYMRGWIGLFDDSEISVRLPALLFGLASIVLLYVVSREYLGDSWAVLPPALLAVSPVHIWYSQEARSYSALLFVTLLSFLAYSRTRRPDSHPVWYVLYGISLLAATMMHYFSVAYSAALTVLCLLEHRGLRSKIVVLSLNLLVLLAFIGFVLYKQQYVPLLASVPFLRTFTPREWWGLFFNWFLLGNVFLKTSTPRGWEVMLQRPEVSALQIAGCLAFLRGAFLLSRGDAASRQLFTFLCLLPGSLFAFTILGARNVYIERSLFVILPFFSLILARGVVGFRRPLWSVLATTALVLVSTLSLGVYLSLKDDAWTVYKPNPDWRSTARVLVGERERTASTVTVFAFSPATELRHYDSHALESTPIQGGYQPEIPAGAPRLVINYSGSPNDLCGHAVQRSMSEFFVVHNRWWSPQFDEILKSLQNDPRCQILEVHFFNGIELYKVGALG
jgi:mannosyltransferase